MTNDALTPCRLRVQSCAVAGRPGASAYEIAVLNGYSGTQEQWLASLKGDKGDAGSAGAAGANAVIWYTSSAPTSRSALSGGYIATADLQGPSGAAIAAGQMIVSSDTGKAYWIAGPEDDGVVPLETYDIQITANS